MTCKEMTLKEAFDKLYRESVQHFAKISKELFFNKTKLVLAKEKIGVPNKIKSSITDKTGGISEDESENKTWKTVIFKRKKPAVSTRKRVKSLKEKKENLRDLIDQLYLYHLFGETKCSATQKETKVTKRNLYLKKRKQQSQNQKIRGRWNKPRTSDNKIHLTLRPKRKIFCYPHKQRESESSLEYSDVKSVNDSGVFFEDSQPTTDNEVFTNKLLQKRKMFPDGSDGSNVKRFKHFLQTKDPKKSIKCKSNMKLKSEYDTCEEEISEAVHTCHKSTSKNNIPDFEPLFASHCGGAWKSIIDEN